MWAEREGALVSTDPRGHSARLATTCRCRCLAAAEPPAEPPAAWRTLPPSAPHTRLRSPVPHPRHPNIVQDQQARGREVLLPVGCSDYDEWLLDALSVDRLLKQLRGGATRLDLINACVSTSTTGGTLAAAARRESMATPPRGGSALEDGAGVQRLMSGEATPLAAAAAAAEAEADGEDAALPQLHLASLRVGELRGRGAGGGGGGAWRHMRTLQRPLLSLRQLRKASN